MIDTACRILRENLNDTMASITEEAFYPRAPILEAVVELRFPTVPMANARKAVSSVKTQYDSYTEEMQVEGKLDFQSKSASFKELGPKLKCASSDQTNGYVVTTEAVVWYRLAPYDGWPSFYRRIAQEMPKVLKALGNPEITRIGTRYVNRIDFPIRDELAYHEDYLKFRIDGGQMLDVHNGFQWTVQKTFPDLGLNATIQSGTAQSEIPGHSAVFFDIDVYRQLEVPRKSDDILICLDVMRLLKNDIFEAGITDEARNLFNEQRD